ncbi:MAG: YHS domain-containing (seleno)protein [Pseudomonadota bacterium]
MLTNRRMFLLGTGAAAIAATTAGALILSQGERLEGGRVFTVDGIAIRGTDPVAYFTEGAPVPGRADFAHDWRGATWHFASAENRDLFVADPEAYAPQYGGYCAWAVAAKGSLETTQPENWSIVEGRLFLNYNDDVQDMWDEDRSGFIAEADRRWPEVMQTQTS